jgi:hypothetical protein
LRNSNAAEARVKQKQPEINYGGRAWRRLVAGRRSDLVRILLLDRARLMAVSLLAMSMHMAMGAAGARIQRRAGSLRR